MIVAHAGQPPTPHDIWTSWNADPVLIGGFVLVGWVYWAGRTAAPRRRTVHTQRDWSFAAALTVLAAALVSPLDALSRALASAHMVQHLLLVLVAAPLLAFAAPSGTLLRGSPAIVRRAAARWRRRLRLTPSRTRAMRRPVLAWLLHVGTLWFWHAAVPYGAALKHEPVHVLEHAGFLLTGILFWRVLVGTAGAGRASPGLGVLLVFALALQSAFLSLLLTFAGEPWYRGYATTTAAWNLDPLADQRLAGVIMWIPGGFVHLAAALVLLLTWISRTEAREPEPENACNAPKRRPPAHDEPPSRPEPPPAHTGGSPR